MGTQQGAKVHNGVHNGVFGYTTGRIVTQQEAGRIVTQWSVWVHDWAHRYTTGSGAHCYTMKCLGTQPGT